MFAFPLSYKQELIAKKDVALLKRKKTVNKANVTENNEFIS